MPAGLAIRRLSARVPAQAQPLAARLALQLLGADLEDALPAGLPPQALLWLRRLQLQAPEAALLRPARGGWRQDWVAAGRRQLDAALARAARPALGPVPDAAPAVLFADAAEMLACLALAAQAGQLDRWWWRGLLGRAWPQPQAAWAARPEAQAAAVRLLRRAGQGAAAERWAGAGMPREAAPAAASGGAAVPAFDAAPVTVPPSRHVLPDVPGAVDTGPRPAAPRLPVETPAAASLPRRARARAPAAPPVARDGMAAPGEPAASPPGPIAVRPSAPSAGEAPRPAAPGGAPGVLPPGRAARESDRPPQATPTARIHRLHEAAGPPARATPPEAAAAMADAAVGRRSPPSQRSRPSASAIPVYPPAALASPAAADVRSPAAPVPWPAPPEAPPASSAAPPTLGGLASTADSAVAWPWPQAFASRQASLFFVVNALLEDGLYPDFTRPRDPGLPVPLWALLAALGAAWRLPADALQAALCQRCGDWPVRAAMPAAPGVAAGAWSVWLPAYARALRRRLCRRLGMRPAAWPQALTLARPARLWLSEAEWVAEFELDSHDVAWRLAGLDRDPGWLPSAGCSLRFVFTA